MHLCQRSLQLDKLDHDAQHERAGRLSPTANGFRTQWETTSRFLVLTGSETKHRSSAIVARRRPVVEYGLNEREHDWPLVGLPAEVDQESTRIMRVSLVITE